MLALQLKTDIKFKWGDDAMVICLCRAVNDRTIRGAIDDGARTVREVCSRTGAASSCGSCARDVAKLIGEHNPASLRLNRACGPCANNDHAFLVPAAAQRDTLVETQG